MKFPVPEAKTTWEWLSALTFAPQQLPIEEFPNRDDRDRLPLPLAPQISNPGSRIYWGQISEGVTTGSADETPFSSLLYQKQQESDAPSDPARRNSRWKNISTAKRSELGSNGQGRGRHKRPGKGNVKGGSFITLFLKTFVTVDFEAATKQVSKLTEGSGTQLTISQTIQIIVIILLFILL